jgi:magnesium-transporting ATPase (P-type)
VDSDHLEKDWSLPALGAMIDPAREEVKPALMKAMARAFARS